MPEQHEPQKLERLARDLFRHLDNPKRLRRNALVSEYFARTDAASQDQIPLEIRSGLVAAARSAYRADVSRDLQRRGERTLAIITGLCNGGSAKQVASDLGMSLPQFYRERRSAILRTVAIFIEHRERFVIIDVENDVFTLRLIRIAALIDQGLAHRAMVEAQGLLRAVATKREVIPVLCELSRAAYEFGDLAGAKSSSELARRKLEEPQLEREQTDLLDARIRLVEYYVSCMEEGPLASYHRIAALTADLRQNHQFLSDGIFAVEVLLNACRSAVLVGRPERAREALDSATKIALEQPFRATLQGKVDFMRAYAANASATLEPLESLTAALRSAQHIGSVQGSLFAALGLADFFISQGRDEHAKQHSEIAYRVACTTEGDYLITCVIDAVAAILLHTSQWQYAEELLKEHPLPSGPYYEMRSACFEAQLLLRRGENSAALGLLVEAAREAERLQQFRSLGMILSDLAVAELKCGYRNRALATGRDADEMVQRFGSASMRMVAQRQLADLLTAG